MTKKRKNEVFYSEEQNEMMKFFKILLIVVILVIGVYLFTRIVVTKDLLNDDDEKIKEPVLGKVDYTKTLIGNMFNKPENEYYVFIFDSEDMNSIYYSGIITAYKNKSDSLKVYVADLHNELNKKYIDSEKTNTKTNNHKEFKVNSPVLLKIKDETIVNSYVSDEEFQSVLTKN